MLTEGPLAVTARVANVLDALGIPYFVSGSLASTLYGIVRTTLDSDIVAEMHVDQVKAFVTMLGDDFYFDELMIANAISRCSSFNIIHCESMFKVDIFIPVSRPFLSSQFSRARKTEFSLHGNADTIMFGSPEDTLLSKMEWYKQGGEVSDRQWRDIIGLLITQGNNLDQVYLRHWAEALELSALFERALTEAA